MQFIRLYIKPRCRNSRATIDCLVKPFELCIFVFANIENLQFQPNCLYGCIALAINI